MKFMVKLQNYEMYIYKRKMLEHVLEKQNSIIAQDSPTYFNLFMIR